VLGATAEPVDEAVPAVAVIVAPADVPVPAVGVAAALAGELEQMLPESMLRLGGIVFAGQY
jgi:hypothetical protein